MTPDEAKMLDWGTWVVPTKHAINQGLMGRCRKNEGIFVGLETESGLLVKVIRSGTKQVQGYSCEFWDVA